jgi:hypothetical protein
MPFHKIDNPILIKKLLTQSIRYQQQAASGLRITGPMLQKQARHYAAHLGIMNFAASNGWLANFRRFYNIISVSKFFYKCSPTFVLISYLVLK